MKSYDYQSFIVKSSGLGNASSVPLSVKLGTTYYMVPNTGWGDGCNYVVEKSTKEGYVFGPLLKWKVHGNAEYIQFYWQSPGVLCNKNTPYKFINGDKITIIRLKFRAVFKCLLRLMVLKRRVQIRIKTRKNLVNARLFAHLGIGHRINTQIIASFV
jgi:hypothetical protein